MNRRMFRVNFKKLLLKINLTFFKLIRHIGIGAFGKVTLVRKKDTDQVYAMKTLIKADVIQVYILNEKFFKFYS